MNEHKLISTATLCTQYNIEISFIDALHTMDLIQIEIIEQNHFIHPEQLGTLEKIIRLHYELNVNLEGIDIVFNLLEKERALKNELISLRNRLRLYENE
jgi:hypothetical protein